MKHLDPTELSAHLDGALTGQALERVSAHLAGCASCRDALAVLEAQDRTLAGALAHDPGEAYFESFADRVASRIGSGEARAAVPVRGGGARGFFEWLRTPAGLSLAGATAAVIVGAGIVLTTARNTGLSSLRRPEIEAHSRQVAEGPTESPGDAPREAGSDQDRVGPVRGTDAPPLRKTAPAPTEPNAPEGATTADDRAEPVAPTSSAIETPPLAAKSVTPSRAIRVREDERGEQQRIGKQRATPFATPPATAPPGPGESGWVPKPRATPLASGAATKEEARAEDKLGIPEGQNVRPSAAERTARPPAAGLADAPSQSPAPSAARQSVAGERESRANEAATVRLCGRVVDTNGRPIAGAEVALIEVAVTTRTGADGHYCLDATPGQRTLVVMAVGFEVVRRPVTIAGSSAESDVILRPVPVFGDVMDLRRRVVGERAKPTVADPFASWPEAAREPARRAEAATERATRLKVALAYDRAAGEWTGVVEKAHGTEVETDARRRLAEVRYRAWAIGSTRQRAIAAMEALEGYLERAPVGPAREEAARRLERVRR